MKKLMILAAFVAAIGLAQAKVHAITGETEQFYTIEKVNKGTRLSPDFVGYLRAEDNHVCGAHVSVENIGEQACAVMKTKVHPKAAGIAKSYYRIIKAHHGTDIPNLVGWLENNRVCGARGGKGVGTEGCAVIHASPY